MKKWIVKQLMNCKWIKEALYEALWKEYVEKLQKDFNGLERDYKLILEDNKRILADWNRSSTMMTKIVEEFTKVKETLMKAFPISDSFDTVVSALVKCADVIMPLFPKKEVEEEPKKKRKYTKKKK